jgi:hypothetical protein
MTEKWLHVVQKPQDVPKQVQKYVALYKQMGMFTEASYNNIIIPYLDKEIRVTTPGSDSLRGLTFHSIVVDDLADFDITNAMKVLRARKRST